MTTAASALRLVGVIDFDIAPTLEASPLFITGVFFSSSY